MTRVLLLDSVLKTEKTRRLLQASFLLSGLACSLSPVPAAVLEISPETAKQGETLKVVIREQNSDTSDAPSVVQFNKRTYRVFPEKKQADNEDVQPALRALIAIPADLSPGKYKISAGNLEKDITVKAGNFPVQVMSLPKGKDNFKSSPGEEEAVNAAKANLSPQQFWQGKFLQPSKARVSTGFGLRRRVNGKLLDDYFHSGLDFAAAPGSPVIATAQGKVLLAHNGWKLHGNTICIDHGQGVASFYIHLSKIFVKEGDMVKAGQKIGAVGSTGRANGPHLHFSIYVNKDSTNPYNWFNNSY